MANKKSKGGGEVITSAGTQLGGHLPSGGKLAGPLYVEPSKGSSLGGEPVGGPTGGPSVRDPLGYLSPNKLGGKKGK